MLVVIIGSQLLKRPCTILSSFIHWLNFLSALEIWGRSGIGHFAFVCSVPYPLRICKAEGYLVLLQNVHANVAIFMLTKENRKVCNKTKTPPTSLLGHRGLSWLLPFLSILVSKVSIDFSIFLRVRGNDLQRGESNSQSSEEEKKVFSLPRHFEACSLSHWEKSWKNSVTTLD